MNRYRPGFAHVRIAGLIVAGLGVAVTCVNVHAQYGESSDCIVDRLAQNKVSVNRAVVSILQCADDGAGIDGTCAQETVTYSTHNFQSGGFIAQAGMVNTEIAAVTFTLPALSFPIRVDRIDALVGTQNLAAQLPCPLDVQLFISEEPAPARPNHLDWPRESSQTRL